MDGCIFCKIASGKMGTDLVNESEEFVAFKDIKPAAPVHALVIPRRHVETTTDLGGEGPEKAGAMLAFAVETARKLGLAEGGYRIVANCGPDGGQEVPHVHFHILGGRRMGWPPG